MTSNRATSAHDDSEARDRRHQPPPPELLSAAFYGPVGEYVLHMAPRTEAAPAAMLASALAAVGALIGRGPTWHIDGAAHHPRFFVLLCGPSASGRKSTAMSRGARQLLRLLDDDFLKARVTSGLSTGEGLIDAVRDPQPDIERADGNGKAKVIPGDPGVQDKRLLVLEDELGGVFQKLGREGNSLSAVLREAWDGRELRTLTRSNKLTATDPHIAIVGCITPADLRQSLKAADVLNGLANRFLLVWTNRAQLLPHGADEAPVPAALRRDLLEAVDRARRVGVMRWADDGAALWADVYPELTAPSAGGSLAALLARGAPQVRRLAMLYAALDGSSSVTRAHLEAALAFWLYCSESTRYVYRTAESLTPRQQRILAALHEAGPNGLSLTGVRAAINSNNVPGEEIQRELAELQEAGLATIRQLSKARVAWVHTHHLGAQASQDSQLSHSGDEGIQEVPQVSQISHSQGGAGAVGPGVEPFDWSTLMEDAA